ncbi:MAG: zf-HC2 domain-containing protein [Acidobacteriia bacterium]|nr:zf-HC2 domain-containing protein [Terriglobia bacterium]
MKCGLIEERLSEYVERTLPHEEMVQVAEHLQECHSCLVLMEEMRSMLVTCRAFPSYEVDAALLDRILLRTSGRPRTRSFRERLRTHFLRPALTPRFAMSAGLGLLFVALAVDLMVPRANVLASVLSPKGLLLKMDRGVQQLYSEGLRLYNAKNEWQTQFSSIKNNVFGTLGDMIQKLDVPVEGKKKPAEQKQQEKNPGQKSSVWLFPA